MSGAGFGWAAALGALLAADGALADDGFDDWIDGLRREALEQGVSETTLDRAFQDAVPIDRVLRLQTRQPEAVLTWAEYARRIVPEARVVEGRRQLENRRALLDEIGARYGVQPRFVVALWGVESDYGRNAGDTPAVSALATLAWKGRRRDYFRRELLELLTAADAGYADAEGLVSSWAGALGQCQFMPSNFRRFSVDWDEDGRRDIWGTPADVLASIARFLAHLGWKDDETWGRQVLLPNGFDQRLSGTDVRMKLARWDALDIRRLNGAHLPTRDLWSTLILPDGPGGESFLVYDDFFTLMRWNRSTHFALSVGRLADLLR